MPIYLSNELNERANEYVSILDSIILPVEGSLLFLSHISSIRFFMTAR